jgi:hypothetical protein
MQKIKEVQAGGRIEQCLAIYLYARKVNQNIQEPESTANRAVPHRSENRLWERNFCSRPNWIPRYSDVQNSCQPERHCAKEHGHDDAIGLVHGWFVPMQMDGLIGSWDP